MAPHSSILAWEIPWTEEPGKLQSMGSLRVRHDWTTSLSRIGEGNGSPLQCSCLENPRDGGAWWAAVYGVAQSRTRLKQLSSSSSSNAKEENKVKVKSCSVLSDSLRLYSPWNSLGQNTGVDSLSLLQGIFPTQGLNPGLLHCRQILYQLGYEGNLINIEMIRDPINN